MKNNEIVTDELDGVGAEAVEIGAMIQQALAKDAPRIVAEDLAIGDTGAVWVSSLDGYVISRQDLLKLIQHQKDLDETRRITAETECLNPAGAAPPYTTVWSNH